MNNYMAIKCITWKKQILRKVQSSKTEPGRSGNYEQPNYKQWNWSCDLKKKKISQKTKAQDQMASKENSIKHYRQANPYPSKTLSENCRGRKTSKLILWGHHHPDTKTKDNTHTKRKLQANITDEHRCKNP